MTEHDIHALRAEALATLAEGEDGADELTDGGEARAA